MAPIQNQPGKYMEHNKSYLQQTKWFVKTFTATLSVSNHEYVFSFNLTIKFNDYAFLLFSNNMHTKKLINHLLQDCASANIRSHLAPIVTKLQHKPVNAL